MITFFPSEDYSGLYDWSFCPRSPDDHFLPFRGLQWTLRLIILSSLTRWSLSSLQRITVDSTTDHSVLAHQMITFFPSEDYSGLYDWSFCPRSPDDHFLPFRGLQWTLRLIILPSLTRWSLSSLQRITVDSTTDHSVLAHQMITFFPSEDYSGLYDWSFCPHSPDDHFLPFRGLQWTLRLIILSSLTRWSLSSLQRITVDSTTDHSVLAHQMITFFPSEDYSGLYDWSFCPRSPDDHFLPFRGLQWTLRLIILSSLTRWSLSSLQRITVDSTTDHSVLAHQMITFFPSEDYSGLYDWSFCPRSPDDHFLPFRGLQWTLRLIILPSLTRWSLSFLQRITVDSTTDHSALAHQMITFFPSEDYSGLYDWSFCPRSPDDHFLPFRGLQWTLRLIILSSLTRWSLSSLRRITVDSTTDHSALTHQMITFFPSEDYSGLYDWSFCPRSPDDHFLPFRGLQWTLRLIILSSLTRWSLSSLQRITVDSTTDHSVLTHQMITFFTSEDYSGLYDWSFCPHSPDDHFLPFRGLQWTLRLIILSSLTRWSLSSLQRITVDSTTDHSVLTHQMITFFPSEDYSGLYDWSFCPRSPDDHFLPFRGLQWTLRLIILSSLTRWSLSSLQRITVDSTTDHSVLAHQMITFFPSEDYSGLYDWSFCPRSPDDHFLPFRGLQWTLRLIILSSLTRWSLSSLQRITVDSTTDHSVLAHQMITFFPSEDYSGLYDWSFCPRSPDDHFLPFRGLQWTLRLIILSSLTRWSLSSLQRITVDSTTDHSVLAHQMITFFPSEDYSGLYDWSFCPRSPDDHFLPFRGLQWTLRLIILPSLTRWSLSSLQRITVDSTTDHSVLAHQMITFFPSEDYSGLYDWSFCPHSPDDHFLPFRGLQWTLRLIILSSLTRWSLSSLQRITVDSTTDHSVLAHQMITFFPSEDYSGLYDWSFCPRSPDDHFLPFRGLQWTLRLIILSSLTRWSLSSLQRITVDSTTATQFRRQRALQAVQ